MKKPYCRPIVAAITVLCLGIQVSQAAKPPQTFSFVTVRKPGTLDRVVVRLEVGGELKEQERLGAKITSTPFSAECDITYDERTLEIPAAAAGRWRSVRSYEKAAAKIKRGDEIAPALRAQRSLIAVQVDAQAATLFSPRGPLTREELEVTDVLANSLLLEQFLPNKPLAVGQSWKHGEKLMAMFLGLDAVTQCDVQSTLKEVTDTVARFEVSGTVDGTRLDVATKIGLKGKYRFDLRLKRIDWFGVVVNEQKPIGKVERGLDAQATVQVRITPKDSCPALDDAALKGLALESDAALKQLQYEPRDGQWQVLHERRWQTAGDRPDLAVWRFVDRGDYIAHCRAAVAPQRRADKPMSLDEFKDDVRRTLGKNLSEIVEAKELSDTGDRRVYRVVAKGEPNEVPMQWHYYLVADPQGRAVALAFLVEQKLADRLADEDAKFVAGIRFIEPKTAGGKK
jgi:hypothetical protein